MGIGKYKLTDSRAAQWFRMHFSGKELRAQLLRGGVGSFILKIASALFALLVVVLLARTLGPKGYGVYAYVFALISLLSVPAQVGLPTLVMRETAKAQVGRQWGLMRGLWRWCGAVVVLIAVALALLALAAGEFYQGSFSELQFVTLVFGLLLVPLMALGNLCGAALMGLRRVIAGQLPESVLRPVLFILLLLIALVLVPAERYTAATAMALHVLASALAFLIGIVLLWRARPIPLLANPVPEYEVRLWLISALPLALISGMMLINQHTDILMLGLFCSTEEIGIYRVVVSAAMLVAFGLQAINMVVSPHIARLFAQGDNERLQRLVTHSARLILLLAIPVAVVFIVYGRSLLIWFFGEPYASGHVPLSILVVGQLVNAFMGSVGVLLNMTGHERDAVRGVAIAAASNVVLNLILIPSFGMTGAAMATSCSIAVWNLILWRAVRSQLHIDSTAFNFKVLKRLK